MLCVIRRPLREARDNLRKVLEPRLALRHVPLEPAYGRSFVLRRSSLGIEMHELEGVLEPQVREFSWTQPVLLG